MNKWIIAYAIVGLLTFGYSYNVDYRISKSPYVSTEEINGYGAFFAGAIWPLYWITQAFKPLRPA